MTFREQPRRLLLAQIAAAIEPQQHQVEQPRRQHAAHAQTEPRAEPGFFLRMGWGAVSVGRDSGTFAGLSPWSVGSLDTALDTGALGL